MQGIPIVQGYFLLVGRQVGEAGKDGIAKLLGMILSNKKEKHCIA